MKKSSFNTNVEKMRRITNSLEQKGDTVQLRYIRDGLYHMGGLNKVLLSYVKTVGSKALENTALSAKKALENTALSAKKALENTPLSAKKALEDTPTRVKNVLGQKSNLDKKLINERLEKEKLEKKKLENIRKYLNKSEKYKNSIYKTIFENILLALLPAENALDKYIHSTLMGVNDSYSYVTTSKDTDKLIRTSGTNKDDARYKFFLNKIRHILHPTITDEDLYKLFLDLINELIDKKNQGTHKT